jgi:hypothetical protein
MVATGKKMAVVFYTMVKNKKEYDVSIYAKSKEKTLAKRIKKLRAKILRIQNEQAQTGLKVTDGTE